jgi:hypothetical protein
VYGVVAAEGAAGGDPALTAMSRRRERPQRAEQLTLVRGEVGKS